MKITKKHRDMFIASAIGDGYISKNGVLTIAHSIKQEDYLLHKAELLKPFLTPKGITKRLTGEGNRHQQVNFTCKVSKFSKAVRRILYKDGKKVLSRKILNRLLPEHIAIWWMDDGSCSLQKTKEGKVHGSISTLSTCTSREQNQIIIDWFFEKYGIKFNQRKMKNHYALVCGTREGRKLKDLIEPYVIDSMKYKLSY